VAVCLLVLVSGAPFNAVEKPWFYNGDVNRKPYFSLEVSKIEFWKEKDAHRSDCAFGFTSIGKYAMKKHGVNGQWRKKLFSIDIHRF
jgi:hypothetical protein